MPIHANVNHGHGRASALRRRQQATNRPLPTLVMALGALGEQIVSLERRAVGAETRLEEALKRPTGNKRKLEKPHQQDLIDR